MTNAVMRYSAILVILGILMSLVRLLLSSTDVMSETISEPNPAEAPPADLGTTTQRLIEKINELDEKHIEREKLISELKQLLLPEGYRALDFGSEDIVAKLYLIANVRPGITGDVLSYHKDSISQLTLNVSEPWSPKSG